MQQIVIFTGNHINPLHSEDLFKMLSSILVERGHRVIFSQKILANHVNFLVDEFTNRQTNEEIEQIVKEYPQTKLIILATEFFTKNNGLWTFNNFSEPNRSGLVGLANIIIKLRHRHFGNLSKEDVWSLVKSLHLNILNIQLLISPRKLIKLAGSVLYMQKRYLGFSRMMSISWGIILAHPAIADGYCVNLGRDKILGSIYPEFEKNYLFEFKKNANFGFEITGSITDYRLKCRDYLNQKIKSSKKFALFREVVLNGFEVKGKERKPMMLSLHPPQREKWPFSSPVRVYGAIIRDQTIPFVLQELGSEVAEPIDLLTVKFYGSDTLDWLCHIWDGNGSKLEALMNKKIQAYNEHATMLNDKVIRQFERRIQSQ